QRVRVVHVVRITTSRRGAIDGSPHRAGLLLPDEPRLVVGDRAVAVIDEPQGRGRRAGRGRTAARRRRGRRAQPGGAGSAATLLIRRAGGAVRLQLALLGAASALRGAPTRSARAANIAAKPPRARCDMCCTSRGAG